MTSSHVATAVGQKYLWDECRIEQSAALIVSTEQVQKPSGLILCCPTHGLPAGGRPALCIHELLTLMSAIEECVTVIRPNNDGGDPVQSYTLPL